VVVLARGGYDEANRAVVASSGAPAWAHGCPRADRPWDSTACGHVVGRVVWRQLEDPDGDGDRHLIVVARLRVRIVKLPRRLPLGAAVPGVGARIEATGWIIRGASGEREIVTARLHWGARTVTAG
jgi:hypothetical protein